MIKPSNKENSDTIDYKIYEGRLLKRLSTQTQMLIRFVKQRPYGDGVSESIDFIETLIKQHKIQKH